MCPNVTQSCPYHKQCAKSYNNPIQIKSNEKEKFLFKKKETKKRGVCKLNTKICETEQSKASFSSTETACMTATLPDQTRFICQTTGSVLQSLCLGWQQFWGRVETLTLSVYSSVSKPCESLVREHEVKNFESSCIRFLVAPTVTVCYHTCPECNSTPVVLMAVFLWALLQAQGEINAVNNTNDDGLPSNQISEPVEKLPVKDMRLLPAGN